MEIKWYRTLAIEIYKTLNDLNPAYMIDIFHLPMNRTSKRLANLKTNRFKIVKFEGNSLKTLGTILLNSLPFNARKCLSLYNFKCFIRNWGAPNCPNLEKFYSYYNSIKWNTYIFTNIEHFMYRVLCSSFILCTRIGLTSH